MTNTLICITYFIFNLSFFIFCTSIESNDLDSEVLIFHQNEGIICSSYVYSYNLTVIIDEKDCHLSDVDVVSTENPNSGKITTKLTMVMFVLS